MLKNYFKKALLSTYSRQQFYKTMTTEHDQLIELSHKLLDCISRSDWQAYESLCDPTLTCFEPEALGHLVEGMDFHKFYFNLPSSGGVKTPTNTTMASPHVRVMGDVAVVSYVRLI